MFRIMSAVRYMRCRKPLIRSFSSSKTSQPADKTPPCNADLNAYFTQSKFDCGLYPQWEHELQLLDAELEETQNAYDELKEKYAELDLNHRALSQVQKQTSGAGQSAKVAAVLCLCVLLVAGQVYISNKADREMKHEEFEQKEKLRVMAENQKTRMRQRLVTVYTQDALAKSLYVPREQLEQSLRNVIGQLDGNYYVYAGEKGTGKSSALFNVCDGRSHVCVVEIPEACSDELFVEILCDKLGVDRDAIGHTDTPLNAFDTVMDWFEEVCIQTRDEDNDIVTLVLDDINFLATDSANSLLLPALQNRIKRFATKRICSVMTIVSEPTFVTEYLTHDTRAQIRYVGPLQENVAIQLLQRHLGRASGAAKGIMSDMGVFAQHLVTVAARVRQGEDVSAAVEGVMAVEKARFLGHMALEPLVDATTVQSCQPQKASLAQAQFYTALLRKKSVPKHVALDLLGHAELNLAIKRRVLAFNPVNNEITFQSQLMEHVVRQTLLTDQNVKQEIKLLNEVITVQELAAEQRKRQMDIDTIYCHNEESKTSRQCLSRVREFESHQKTLLKKASQLKSKQDKLRDELSRT